MLPQRDRSGRFKKAGGRLKRAAQQLQARHQDEGQVQLDEVAPPVLPSAPLDLPMSHKQNLFVHETVGYDAFFLERIQSAIDYTHSQLSQNLPILQTTRFLVQLPSASFEPPQAHVTALTLLRSCAAPIVYTSDTHNVFELGVPSPYMVAGSVGHTLINDPQWWMNKSAAEVKAGLFADEEDVRKAQAKIKEVETKKRKRTAPTKKQTNIDWKLAEGLRRQEGGLDMFDVEDEDFQNEEDEEEDVCHEHSDLDDEEDGMEI